MNKPVAIRYDFDGYGYQYMDSGSGSDWQTRVDGEPLYTHPVKELNDGGEPVKNATYWKRQHDNLLMKLNTCAIKVSELEKKSHPVKENCCPDCGCHFTGEYPFNYTVKELTDEEIMQVADDPSLWRNDGVLRSCIDFAKAILRKAQEK